MNFHGKDLFEVNEDHVQEIEQGIRKNIKWFLKDQQLTKVCPVDEEKSFTLLSDYDVKMEN